MWISLTLRVIHYGFFMLSYSDKALVTLQAPSRVNNHAEAWWVQWLYRRHHRFRNHHGSRAWCSSFYIQTVNHCTNQLHRAYTVHVHMYSFHAQELIIFTHACTVRMHAHIYASAAAQVTCVASTRTSTIYIYSLRLHDVVHHTR